MSDGSFASAPGPEPVALGPAGHPPVADLILYALGKVPMTERQQIETHLRQAGCSDCRRWIDQATRLHGQPPAPSGPSLHAPDSSTWRQQAFQELERRLQRLEEN